MNTNTNRNRIEQAREALNFNQAMFFKTKKKGDKDIYFNTAKEFDKQLKRWCTIENKEQLKNQLSLF